MPTGSRLVASALTLALAGCGGKWTVPSPAETAAAAATTTYNARLRIALDGPTLRARTPVLLAFRRPDALRIEVPGPAGPRLVAPSPRAAADLRSAVARRPARARPGHAARRRPPHRHRR